MFALHTNATNTFTKEFLKNKKGGSSLKSKSKSKKSSSAFSTTSSVSSKGSNTYHAGSSEFLMSSNHSIGTNISASWNGSSKHEQAIRQVEDCIKMQNYQVDENQKLIERALSIASARLQNDNTVGAALSTKQIIQHEQEIEVALLRVEQLYKLKNKLMGCEHWFDYAKIIKNILETTTTPPVSPSSNDSNSSNTDDSPSAVSPSDMTTEELLKLLNEKLKM